MNKLSFEKQSLILSLLTEGNSIRSIERLTGVTAKAICKLLVHAGEKAEYILRQEMININTRFMQVDEIWTFVQKKQNRLSHTEKQVGEFGDKYVYVAIDADTKLVPLHMVGVRSRRDANRFMFELNKRLSSKTKNRFQLTTDGFIAYRHAVYKAFDNVDYAQIHKKWARDVDDDRKYSPAPLIEIQTNPIFGNPNEDYASTSFVERQNLTMRMHMRRFTRLSNGFSKKLRNLEAAVALHFYWYNFMNIHSSIRMTPAMKAGLTHSIWNWADLLNGGRMYKMVA